MKVSEINYSLEDQAAVVCTVQTDRGEMRIYNDQKLLRLYGIDAVGVYPFERWAGYSALLPAKPSDGRPEDTVLRGYITDKIIVKIAKDFIAACDAGTVLTVTPQIPPAP